MITVTSAPGGSGGGGDGAACRLARKEPWSPHPASSPVHRRHPPDPWGEDDMLEIPYTRTSTHTHRYTHTHTHTHAHTHALSLPHAAEDEVKESVSRKWMLRTDLFENIHHLKIACVFKRIILRITMHTCNFTVLHNVKDINNTPQYSLKINSPFLVLNLS